MFKKDCDQCGNQIPEYQLVKDASASTCDHCNREQQQMLDDHFDWEEDRVV